MTASTAGSLWRGARRWARGLAGTPGAADTAPPGRTLGGYRLERELARGAMGVLHLATDPSDGTPRVLKTMDLAREFDAEALADARARFFQEAESAARLDHPGIVRVFGAGDDRGLAWIAMEALPGSDLTRYTRPSRLLPEPIALDVAAQVADALAYAHGEGVLHRDVKPANVMLDPSTLKATLTDFGIARITDGTRTRTGVVAGTPAYMSPEQLAGAPLDGASDLYALGVLLFELLTGRLPHEGATLGALMRAIAREAPPDLRLLRPDAPVGLAELLNRALAKSPRERFADGHEFAQALRAVPVWTVKTGTISAP